MAYVISTPTIGFQPIATTDSTKRHLTGTIVKAADPIYGEGEFIYLKGAASTAVGDVVSYNTSDGATNDGATTRWAGTAGSGFQLAVAMSANVASQYGWYQIAGSAVVNTNGTVASGDKAFWQATSTVSTTQVNGKQALGMTASSANGVPATNQAVYVLDRPSAQGQVV